MKTLLLLVSFLWAFDERPIAYRLEDSTQQRSILFSAYLKDSLFYFDSGQKEAYQHHYIGDFLAQGQLAEQIFFESGARLITEETDVGILETHVYEPFQGLPFNSQSEEKRTWDYVRGKLYWKNSNTKIIAALDYLKTGPSKRNPLVLAGEYHPWRPFLVDSTLHKPAPMLFWGAELALDGVKYHQYNGVLRHQKNKDKYFHTHRISGTWKGFTLGIQEMVIYGSTTDDIPIEEEAGVAREERNLEWAYNLPFLPYFILEHYVGDRDNNTLSMDLQYERNDYRVYAELLLDDLKSPGQLFDDSWWGNKFGLSLGMEWQKSWKNWKHRALIEWTRIEPWVYTHHKGGGFQYTHYAQGLGSNLGPNSQELYFEWESQWQSYWLRPSFSYASKGTDHGSNYSDIHLTTDPIDKTHLDPQTSLQWMQTGLLLGYNPYEWLSLEAGGSHLAGDFHGLTLQTGLKIGW